MRVIAVALAMALFASAGPRDPAQDARTPEEHLRLAEQYHAQSKALMEESRTWAAMADDYDRNPSSHPIPKFPTYGDHCRSLSRQYLKEAKKAEALALAHERLARERAARTSCSACAAVVALAVKCPIFRPGRGSSLPYRCSLTS